MTQPIVAYRPIKPLDVGILLRIARLDVTQPDLLLLSPSLQLFADLLRAVIAADLRRLATPRDHLLQRPFHPGCRQGEIHLNAQCLTIKVVDHIKEPD